MSHVVRCDRCSNQASTRQVREWSQLVTERDGTHDFCPLCTAAALRWVKAGPTYSKQKP